MASWRLREDERNDSHVRATVFVGPDEERRVYAGRLVLDHDQYDDLSAKLALGYLRDEKASDPRRPGGAIAGPGGPYDEDAVVVDTRRAVILEAAEVAIVGAVRHGVLDQKPISSLVLRGRINKTDERVQALYLMNEDGAAALVTQLIGLASRAGWGSEFLDAVKRRMDEMPTHPPEGTPS